MLKVKKVYTILLLLIISLTMLTGCGNCSAKEIAQKLSNLEKIGYHIEKNDLSTYTASKDKERVKILVAEDISYAKKIYNYYKSLIELAPNAIDNVVERDRNIIYLGTSKQVVKEARQC